jgi:hypothetical protein
VEGGRHTAEGRQNLGCVVDEVAQITPIHRVGAGAQPQVVELHIPTSPRESDRFPLGAKALSRSISMSVLSRDMQRGKVSEGDRRTDYE